MTDKKTQTKPQNKRKPTLGGERTKLFFLTLFGFLFSILPLAILFALRWEDYVTSVPGGAIRLSLGGGMIAVLILLKVLGKLKLPSRLCVMALSLVAVYLLEAVLRDLALVLWMATLGEAVDAFLFAPLIKRTRKSISIMQQADATADRVEELLKTYVKGA